MSKFKQVLKEWRPKRYSTGSSTLEIDEDQAENSLNKIPGLEDKNAVILAVAHGIDKTVIYSASESVVKKVIQDLIDGKPFNEVRGLLGNSVAATNAADYEEALRAEKIEANADYWIELGNRESYLSAYQANGRS